MPTPADPNALPLEDLLGVLTTSESLDALIAAAKAEDLADRGDITSRVLIEANRTGVAALRARRAGTLAGAVLLPRIAAAYDPALHVDSQTADGASLSPGDTIALVSGPLRSILAAERVMLNFLTHLSGIATATAACVEAVIASGARVYDTRKTVPGMRALAKYAVRCGGGFCHRIGLYDAVLVKDNHLAHIPPHQLKPALDAAIAAARALDPPPAFIEVEVDRLDQLRVVLGCDVDVILLDNLPADELRRAVAIRDQRHPSVQLEASGGVTLDTIRTLAATGVNRIAIGAITHSAKALDIGMDIG